MYISYNWIKQYVDLPDSMTPEDLGLKLTMGVVEVEGVEKQGELLDDIVVGLVKKVKKHPNADKLNVCEVYDGVQSHQVVCGGSNVVEGMKVAFGKIGAKVRWHGEGELIELAKAKIRGVESFGMICASTEIGLGEIYPLTDEKEILDLSSFDVKPGTPLAQALGLDDAIIEIDNKSMTHRPDLWGHYGMAREVALAYHKKLKEYDPKKIHAGTGRDLSVLDLSVRVEDTELCSRYMAVAISGIQVAPSPEWLQKRLIAVGLRPINNIVDITNYVMYDLGQPLHAFDRSKMQDAGNGKLEIIVRRAKEGEKFITLDGQEHELTSDMLVIADSEKPVALAVVMGGLNSEISENTTSIIFESATFDPTNVRRTATKLGIRTDSSARFEKSLDPHNAELALRRAVELTLELCPDAQVASNMVDVKNMKMYQGPIALPLDFLYRKIGKEIELKEVLRILEGLGFVVKEKKDILYVTIPTWRATKDISIPEDLVEEVARVYGFGNIETELPKFSITPPEKNLLRDLERKVKMYLSQEYGYTESVNYSFVSPQLIQKTGLSITDHIELDNPIAKDRPYLRRSLLPNLFENIEKNSHSYDEQYLFEVGKVFREEESGPRVEENGDELLPRQDVYFSAVYRAKKDQMPFFEISSVVRGLLADLGVVYEFKSQTSSEEKYAHPGRSAYIYAGDDCVGMVAELHPATAQNFGVKDRVGFVELNLNTVLKHVGEPHIYRGVSQYPPVLRDIAFVVDKKVEHAQVVKAIKTVDPLIRDLELFDVYAGDTLGEGKKSMAYHITYLSKERTLDAREVDEVYTKVIQSLERGFGAEIRK